MVVSGATGCGKTHLLRRLAASGQQVLDLELLAKHKGARLHRIFMLPCISSGGSFRRTTI
jgi:hypothetical protein